MTEGAVHRTYSRRVPDQKPIALTASQRRRTVAFGAAVRARREAKGLSRLVLAAVTGLSVEDVVDIELGVRMPDVSTLFVLADVLLTDAAELLHETRTRTEGRHRPQ